VRSAFLAIMTITSFAVVPGRAQEPVSGPSREIPELAVLSAYVGKWDDRCEIKRIEGVSEGGTRKGAASAEWVLGGRFVRQTWMLEAAGRDPQLSGSWMMTYDPAKRTYRSWLFVSNGSTSESEGSYDAKTKTFTWKARDADGVRTVTKSSFAEDGAENWAITVTEANVRVLADMKGKNIRRKK
jgi:Protein of unknown function (DUF1579)